MKTKNLIFSTFFLLFLFGCNSPVKRAQKIITERYDINIGKDVLFFTSIIDFYYYANPVNYWYPEEYTYRDILNDKFRLGYKGLTRLNDRLNNIQTDDKNINNGIERLRKEIVLAQKGIKKKQSSLENLNSSFGLLAYGGMNGLMDLNNALITTQEREESEARNRAMPSKVQDAFYSLVDLLDEKVNKLDTGIYNLEKEAFDIAKPNKVEQLQIRNNYKIFITNKIKLNFKSADTLCRDNMLIEFFTRYDTTFALK
jgi:hypothetical protein